MKKFYAFIFTLFVYLNVSAQGTGSISGRVIDKKDNSELIGVTVLVKGTSFGTVTDVNGNFILKGLKPKEYNIEISYLGYQKILETGVKVKAGENTKLETFEMKPSSSNIDEVTIIGRKPLIDIEKAQTINTISQVNIELAPARQIQSIINTQPGVVQAPAGVSIRGGRTYETKMMIDGVSVTDPLAGTGFGLDIGSNAVGDIEVTTGGIGAEVGDATAGVVNTKTRNASDKNEFSINYKRDNFGFNKGARSNWNSQVIEFNASGPMLKKKLNSRLKYLVSARASFSDEFYQNPANQINSSLLKENGFTSTNWTPYQDNRWSFLAKISYDLSKGMKLTATMMRSMTINQDVNMLRIFGNDAPFSPGYQYNFSQQMDNANTYSHDSYLQMINFKHSVNKRFSYNATFSRLLAQLRADANGRDWRPSNVDQVFDPNSINTFPITIFQPTNHDSVVYPNAPSGFYNNNGIATQWHHHYIEEYALTAQGNIFSRNSLNKLTFGLEMKFQNMEWIDITRPWIGAPIRLADGSYTQSFRLGQQSDLWTVSPQRGGFYVTDQIKYKGLIASVGGRFEYWAPGKYVDDAVNDPRSPIRNEIRQDYLNSSVQVGDLRYKFRFLPKINASFPIAENQMLYFNYGHSTILPNASYVYPGLNPLYQDRSTIANLGNPNLNPEVDISYEIGLRSQITNNDALTISAFWKDKYDFITSAVVLVKDFQGRDVSRTIRINSDYARSRGIELGYIKRIGTWYNGQVAFTYTVNTGQSASANEKLKDILASGNVEDTKEYYMPWDMPYDFKSNHVFKIDRKHGLFGKSWLNKMSFYFETVTRSGVRYTPYLFDRIDAQTGRPIYVVNTSPDARWSKVGEYWFWADLTITKWWQTKYAKFSFNVQITNVFDNLNAAIINPVTGKAYQNGDNVPDTWSDPRYVDPRLGNSAPPPTNPARYLAQRHIVLGVNVKF